MKYQIVPFTDISFNGDWRQALLDAGVIAYFPGTGACVVEVWQRNVPPIFGTWSHAPDDTKGSNTKILIVGQIVHLPEAQKRGSKQ
jgi:hypothetical protein